MAIAIIFRHQIGRFIDEVSEVTGFGANAKRAGTLRSEDLKDRTQELEEESDATETDAPKGYEESSSGRNSSSLLDFIGKQVEANLRWARQNSQAASSGALVELIRSTYTDLRLGIRTVAYHLGGKAAVSGKELRHVAPHVALKRIGAPAGLIELVHEARTFATDVRGNSIQVNEQAARNYIDTLLEINRELFQWAKERMPD
ncbi:hypothetical protein BJY19_002720 [Arthrobacter cupressi]|uniref:hypothetical protein n=1 Tax=Arthrobacter cupressi TaxID=1045773 RepID=UPI0011142D41|nr:hypothetical protein [Arthrobacter cupressi]NYD78987.1 hypothetical protein [Arthrobacter cupressi]